MTFVTRLAVAAALAVALGASAQGSHGKDSVVIGMTLEPPGLAGTTRRQRIVLKGELPSPLNPPQGCVFSTRCPHVIERCRVERPALRPLDGRQVSCHLAESFLEPGHSAPASQAA